MGEKNLTNKNDYIPTELTNQIATTPVATMEQFLNYPIIQYLAAQERWTVSDKDKRPINIREYSSTGKLFGASFKFGNPLLSLYQINQSQFPIPDNRAYHFHAKDEQIIMIDVESHARDELKTWALNFPCHYLEASKNNGLHVVLHVPLSLIPEKYRYLFDVTVIKHETTEFEVIFNQHYGTFTRRIIPCQYADFEHNKNHLEQLLFLLQTLAKALSKEQLEKAKKVQERMEYIANVKTEKLEEFMDYIQSNIDQTIETAKTKHTLEKYNYDESKYEDRSLNEVAKMIYKYYRWQQNERKRKKYHKNEGGFQELTMNLTEEEFIYLIYMIGKSFLPQRPKHDELRVGMPYLLYVAQRVWISTDIWQKEKDRRKSDARKGQKNKFA